MNSTKQVALLAVVVGLCANLGLNAVHKNQLDETFDITVYAHHSDKPELNTIQTKAKATTTVEDLKKYIDRIHDIPFEEQLILFDTVEPQNSETIKKAIEHKWTIILAKKSAKPVEMIKFSLYSPIIGNQKVELPSSWTVSDLKKYIEKEYNIGVNKQLIFFGTAKPKDERKLKDAVEKGLYIEMTTKDLEYRN